MKRVFICHPIRGDVTGNIAKVKSILGYLYENCPEILPIAPYLTALEYLDDNDMAQRSQGIAMNRIYFESGFVQEMWVYGDTVSEGMQKEVELCATHKIPVVRHTGEYWLPKNFPEPQSCAPCKRDITKLTERVYDLEGAVLKLNEWRGRVQE